MSAYKFECPDGCGRRVALRKDGTPYKHNCVRVSVGRCDDCGQNVPLREDGSRGTHLKDVHDSDSVCSPLSDPAPTVEAMDDVQDQKEYEQRLMAIPEKGPWFGAMYDGECSECEDPIFEGDRIRADGHGGYECGACESLEEHAERRKTAHGEDVEIHGPAAEAFEDPAPVATAVARVRTMAIPTPEQFMDPSPVGDAEPVMSVSGQPKKVLRDHLDRYCVVLPGETELELFKSSGNPVGRTRATTFNKAAQDSKAINDWGKRNVVIGAARRRDLILQAHDLTHERDRDKLNRLVKELEEAAGAKVGSDLGTYLHEFTEYMDAGLKSPDDAPEEFRRSLWAYEQALLDAGLEPIRALIERTTIIREYGWVCGTFDRIFFHRPSGQYVIGDLKTGKTMDYGKNEIECQLWTYAHGVNQNGIYDWNTRAWHRPDTPDSMPFLARVSETHAVVIHMPVQGDKEGTVTLLWADLESGAEHAKVCADVRARPGGKMKPWGDGPAPLSALTWQEQFAAVRTGEDANHLWRLAKADGVVGVELNDLISIARDALRVKG